MSKLVLSEVASFLYSLYSRLHFLIDLINVLVSQGRLRLLRRVQLGMNWFMIDINCCSQTSQASSMFSVIIVSQSN